MDFMIYFFLFSSSFCPAFGHCYMPTRGILTTPWHITLYRHGSKAVSIIWSLPFNFGWSQCFTDTTYNVHDNY